RNRAGSDQPGKHHQVQKGANPGVTFVPGGSIHPFLFWKLFAPQWLCLGNSEEGPSVPALVRTGSVPAATVWSKTLKSFYLSNIISSRVRPVRSARDVSSMASTGQASSHMPQ